MFDKSETGICTVPVSKFVTRTGLKLLDWVMISHYINPAGTDMLSVALQYWFCYTYNLRMQN